MHFSALFAVFSDIKTIFGDIHQNHVIKCVPVIWMEIVESLNLFSSYWRFHESWCPTTCFIDLINLLNFLLNQSIKTFLTPIVKGRCACWGTIIFQVKHSFIFQIFELFFFFLFLFEIVFKLKKVKKFKFS